MLKRRKKEGMRLVALSGLFPSKTLSLKINSMGGEIYNGWSLMKALPHVTISIRVSVFARSSHQ